MYMPMRNAFIGMVPYHRRSSMRWMMVAEAKADAEAEDDADAYPLSAMTQFI
jgi:hypothetical protein